MRICYSRPFGVSWSVASTFLKSAFLFTFAGLTGSMSSARGKIGRYGKWRRSLQGLSVEIWSRMAKDDFIKYRRDCRKSPRGDSKVRCRKKWPHRMRHNQRSHNCEGSWDPPKTPINYTEGFFDSLGSNLQRLPPIPPNKRGKKPLLWGGLKASNVNRLRGEG